MSTSAFMFGTTTPLFPRLPSAPNPKAGRRTGCRVWKSPQGPTVRSRQDPPRPTGGPLTGGLGPFYEVDGDGSRPSCHLKGASIRGGGGTGVAVWRLDPSPNTVGVGAASGGQGGVDVRVPVTHTPGVLPPRTGASEKAVSPHGRGGLGGSRTCKPNARRPRPSPTHLPRSLTFPFLSSNPRVLWTCLDSVIALN